jgi:hypothetical protein
MASVPRGTMCIGEGFPSLVSCYPPHVSANAKTLPLRGGDEKVKSPPQRGAERSESRGG